MLEKLLPFADYLKDKKLYPLLRHLLNFIFVASASSYMFELFYFKYHLLDWNDFNAIYDFFIKGEFFIPFSIFFVLWISTYFVGYFAFSVANYAVSEKWRKRILDFSTQKSTYQAAKFHVKTRQEVEKRIPEKLDKQWYVKLYQVLKKEMHQNAFQELNKSMREFKDNMTDNFVMIFRGLVATSIYFGVISHFGWILFLLVIIAFLTCTLLFALGYQLGELLPVAVYKFSFEMEKIIASGQSEEFSGGKTLKQIDIENKKS